MVEFTLTNIWSAVLGTDIPPVGTIGSQFDPAQVRTSPVFGTWVVPSNKSSIPMAVPFIWNPVATDRLPPLYENVPSPVTEVPLE